MVVSCHSAILLWPMDAHSFAGSIAHAWIGWASPLGLYGVELFFALSGFLIGRIVFRSATADDRPLLVRLKWFWARRWMRTIPLYLLVLSLNIALTARISHYAWDWRYLVFTQNLLTPHPGFFAAAWSLSVEEWFYLLFPLWILLVSSAFRKGDKRAHLAYATLAFALLFALVRILHIHASPSLNLDSDIRKVVLYRLDAIAYGALAAWFAHFRPLAVDRYRVPIFVVGCLILGLALWLNDHLPTTTPGRTEQGAIILLFLNLSFAALMPLMSSIPLQWLGVLAKPIKFISVISYPMYLCHSSLVLQVFMLPLSFRAWFSPWVLFCLYWICVLLFGFALHLIVEKPVMILRDKLWTDGPRDRSGERQIS